MLTSDKNNDDYVTRPYCTGTFGDDDEDDTIALTFVVLARIVIIMLHAEIDRLHENDIDNNIDTDTEICTDANTSDTVKVMLATLMVSVLSLCSEGPGQ